MAPIREQPILNRVNTVQENAILLTADINYLYPNISLFVGPIALMKALDSRSLEHIPKENLIKIAKFILRNSYFKINGKFFW